MFIFTVLEILLSYGRSVLAPAQWGTGNGGVKVSLKNQKKYSEFVEIAWKVIELQA